MVARHPSERRPTAVFGKTAPVQRRGVEQIDTEREGSLDRRNGDVVGKPYKEIAKRCRPESKDGNFEPRPAKHSTGQSGDRDHMDFFQPSGRFRIDGPPHRSAYGSHFETWVRCWQVWIAVRERWARSFTISIIQLETEPISWRPGKLESCDAKT
jgi:hypothetical protein